MRPRACLTIPGVGHPGRAAVRFAAIPRSHALPRPAPALIHEPPPPQLAEILSRPQPEDRLRGVLELHASIPDAEWEFALPHLRRHRFARGEHLGWEGRVSEHVHFIVRGAVRAYYLDESGRERVRSFAFEGRFAGGSLMDGRPAYVSVQALEPTDTVSIPMRLIPVLYDRHPCWERIGRRRAEQDWINKEEKELRFRMYTPEQHYRLLVEAGSLMTRRVPLRHLASYLGVTPETLSRIRRRIARPPA